jgi:hypothetical protein
MNLQTYEVASPARAASQRYPSYVRDLALLTTLLLIGLQICMWAALLPNFITICDYRTNYTAGYMVRTGYRELLYDGETQYRLQNELASPTNLGLPNIHPAYEAWLYAPLSLLKFRTSYFVYLAFNALLLCVVFRLLRPYMTNLSRVFPLFPAAMFLAFIPVGVALVQGQDSIILLLCVVGAKVLFDRDCEFLAGAVLGLGLFRFQLVLPIALLFFIWRRWRFSAGFAVSSLVVVLISLVTVGIAGTKMFWVTLTSLTGHGMHGDILSRVRPMLMPNLRGVIWDLLHTRVPDLWVNVFVLVASAAVLLAAARAKMKDRFLLATVVSALVSYHFLIHDFSFLILPIVLVLDRFLVLEGTADPAQWLPRLAALVFVVPVLHFTPLLPYLGFASLAVIALFLALLRTSNREDRAAPAVSLRLGGIGS